MGLITGRIKTFRNEDWLTPITLHAFSALVSFGFDDLNESLPRKANSQFARTDTSGDWRVVSCRLFVAAVLIEC